MYIMLNSRVEDLRTYTNTHRRITIHKFYKILKHLYTHTHILCIRYDVDATSTYTTKIACGA